MSRIAFFDFDGTITTRDTLLEFIRFNKGTAAFYWGFVLNSPWLLAYKAKLISNQRAKERILTHFFGGKQLKELEESGQQFTSTKLDTLVRPKALQEINRLKALGVEVVVVTASAEAWVAPWCRAQGIGLLATQLALKQGKITGRIAGANCYGTEKVNRVKAAYALQEFQEVYAYGDTKGDKPLLRLATHSFYKPFL